MASAHFVTTIIAQQKLGQIRQQSQFKFGWPSSVILEFVSVRPWNNYDRECCCDILSSGSKK